MIKTVCQDIGLEFHSQTTTAQYFGSYYLVPVKYCFWSTVFVTFHYLAALILMRWQTVDYYYYYT